MKTHLSFSPFIKFVLCVIGFAWSLSASAEPFAYITNINEHTVSVIDTKNNAVVDLVSEGLDAPTGVGVHPSGTFVYVVNAGNPGYVSVISTSLNTIVAEVTVGNSPIGLAVHPNGEALYVGNLTDGTVSVVDTVNNSVVATVGVGFTPQGLAVIPDGTKVYVANQVSRTVSVIDTATKTVATTINLNGGGPFGVAAHPDGSKVYVSGDRLWVVDTQTDTVIDEIPALFGFGVAVHPDGNTVYVSSLGGFTVSVIDTGTNTIVETVTVGLEPHGIDVHPDGSTIYVANFGTTTVSVIDTATNLVVETVTVGQGPRAFGRFIGPLKNVGGNAIGYTPSHAACLNVTTGDRVIIPIPAEDVSWDCQTAGLAVGSGDKIRVLSQGIVDSPVDSSRFDVLEIDPLPGHDRTRALDINDFGQVTGTSLLTAGGIEAPPAHGFLWDNGVLTDLGDLPGGDDFSVGVALNNFEQVVGSSGQSGPENPGFEDTPFERAFLWEAGTMFNLGFVPGFVTAHTSADSINDFGQVVGGGPAFVWENGVFTNLKELPLEGIIADATDINNDGLIVGFGIPNPGVGSPEAVRAVIVENGQVTFVDNLPDETDVGAGIRFLAVNNLNQIVGHRSSNNTMVPFIWGNGVISDLDVDIGFTNCMPSEINNLGQIVGSCNDDRSGKSTGFIWDSENGFRDLFQLADLTSGGRLGAATGINDLGEVVGNGNNGSFDRAFVLVPERVGGTATGYVVTHAACLNVTTGGRVIIPIPDGEPSWDCEAAGLVIEPGDKVRVGSQGFAE